MFVSVFFVWREGGFELQGRGRVFGGGGGHTGPCCPRRVPRRSGLGGGRRGSRRGRPLLGDSRGGQRSGTLIAAAAAGTAVGGAAAAAGAVVVVAVAESRSIRACPTLCPGAVAWAKRAERWAAAGSGGSCCREKSQPSRACLD